MEKSSLGSSECPQWGQEQMLDQTKQWPNVTRAKHRNKKSSISLGILGKSVFDLGN